MKRVVDEGVGQLPETVKRETGVTASFAGSHGERAATFQEYVTPGDSPLDGDRVARTFDW